MGSLLSVAARTVGRRALDSGKEGQRAGTHLGEKGNKAQAGPQQKIQEGRREGAAWGGAQGGEHGERGAPVRVPRLD